MHWSFLREHPKPWRPLPLHLLIMIINSPVTSASTFRTSANLLYLYADSFILGLKLTAIFFPRLMSENSKKEHDVPPVPGVWNKKGLAEGHSAVAAQFKHTSTCSLSQGCTSFICTCDAACSPRSVMLSFILVWNATADKSKLIQLNLQRQVIIITQWNNSMMGTEKGAGKAAGYTASWWMDGRLKSHTQIAIILGVPAFKHLCVSWVLSLKSTSFPVPSFLSSPCVGAETVTDERWFIPLTPTSPHFPKLRKRQCNWKRRVICVTCE